MKKYVIYAHKSCPDSNGASIENQIEWCKENIERIGGEFVATYSDEPGTDKPRPDYQRLLQDIGSGKFDCVAALSLDHISPDAVDVAHFVNLCHSHNIIIVTLHEGGCIGEIGDVRNLSVRKASLGIFHKESMKELWHRFAEDCGEDDQEIAQRLLEEFIIDVCPIETIQRLANPPYSPLKWGLQQSIGG